MPDFSYNNLYNSVIKNGSEYEQRKLTKSATFYGDSYTANTPYNLTFQRIVSNLSLTPNNMAVGGTQTTALSNNTNTTNYPVINANSINQSAYIQYGFNDMRVGGTNLSISDSLGFFGYYMNTLYSYLINTLPQNQIFTYLSTTLTKSGGWSTNSQSNSYSGINTSATSFFETGTTTFQKPFRYIAIGLINTTSAYDLDIKVNGTTVGKFSKPSGIPANQPNQYPFILMYDLGTEYPTTTVIRLDWSNVVNVGSAIIFCFFATWKNDDIFREVLTVRPPTNSSQWDNLFNSAYETRRTSTELAQITAVNTLREFGLPVSWYTFRYWYCGLFYETGQIHPIFTIADDWGYEILENALTQ